MNKIKLYANFVLQLIYGRTKPANCYKPIYTLTLYFTIFTQYICNTY